MEVVFGGRGGEDAAVAVGVDVNEAWGGGETAGVEFGGGGGGTQVADGGDGVTANADVGGEPGCAGTVDDFGIGDDEVEPGCLSEGGGACEEEGRKGCAHIQIIADRGGAEMREILLRNWHRNDILPR